MTTKAYKGLAMEGPIATWYARNTGIDQRRQTETAHALARRLAAGAQVLEIAPGPGYFSLALARAGDFHVTGLDISRSFVDIARRNALEAGLAIDFRHGNAAALPFDANRFDATFCQAAFKNFTEPVRAIAEMHRVLKPGGIAIIQDLRRDATAEGIGREVARMHLSSINRWFTRMTFDQMLLKSAYSIGEMRAMIAETPFGAGDFVLDDIGFEVTLTRAA